MKRLVNRAAKKILNCWINMQKKRNKKWISYKMYQEIASLDTSRKAEELAYSYMCEKISICILILGSGGVLLLLCGILAAGSKSAEDEGKIERPVYGRAQKEVVWDAVVKEQTYSIDIEIPAREMSDEMITEEFDRIIQELPEKILGENETLLHVTKALNLPSQIEDSPILIRWESNHYDILCDDGSFGERDAAENGEEVILNAVLSYGERQKTTQITIFVFPPNRSAEETWVLKLKKAISQEQEKTSQEPYLSLPKEIESETIVWKEHKDPIILMLGGLLFVTVFLVFVGKDQEIHQKYEQRSRELKMHYPDFVGKIQILIGSGMSMRRAFEKMGDDYRKRRREGGEKQYVYEELLLAQKKLESGVSEEEAYDYFGKRCGISCYKKLMSLIIQNGKKGNSGLLEALSIEMKTAFEERKQTAKRLGEEAGTKLLFPMMLLMGMVFLMIMIPAFLSFGGI